VSMGWRTLPIATIKLFFKIALFSALFVILSQAALALYVNISLGTPFNLILERVSIMVISRFENGMRMSALFLISAIFISISFVVSYFVFRRREAVLTLPLYAAFYLFVLHMYKGVFQFSDYHIVMFVQIILGALITIAFYSLIIRGADFAGKKIV